MICNIIVYKQVAFSDSDLGYFLKDDISLHLIFCSFKYNLSYGFIVQRAYVKNIYFVSQLLLSVLFQNTPFTSFPLVNLYITHAE